MEKPKSSFLYKLTICVVFLITLKGLKTINLRLYDNALFISLAVILAPYAYKLFEKLKII